MPTYRACTVSGCPRKPETPWRKYCREHEAIGRENHRAAASERLKATWEEWKAQGINPTNDNGAGKRRGEKIAVSNREKPRRRKPPQGFE